MSIYICGDVHGDKDIKKLNTTQWPEQKNLTKDDYLIIVGDFGAIWDGSKSDKWLIDWYDKKPFTTLFIDGNHENFDLLYSYPEIEWNGGIARKISDSIYYLTRGQVFMIDGKKFFTMGGAYSIDKMYRTPNISWWSEEIPSTKEMDLGIENLKKHDWNVDVVLTHAAPLDVVERRLYFRTNNLEEKSFLKYLQYIQEEINYQSWFFGHYHDDIDFDGNIHLLYDRVIDLETGLVSNKYKKWEL